MECYLTLHISGVDNHRCKTQAYMLVQMLSFTSGHFLNKVLRQTEHYETLTQH